MYPRCACMCACSNPQCCGPPPSCHKNAAHLSIMLMPMPSVSAQRPRFLDTEAFCLCCSGRLEGQDEACGPSNLADNGSHLETIYVRPSRDCLPSRVSVGFDVQCGPHGNTEVTIHSNIQVNFVQQDPVVARYRRRQLKDDLGGGQVQNSTNIPLYVGLQAPLGLEPRKLGILAPGQNLWLPVIRAEPGLLCLQPSGRVLSVGLSCVTNVGRGIF